MSEWYPPEPPRSHRASRGPGRWLTRVVAPLTAVAVVVVVIALLIWINGRSSGGSGSSAVTAPTSHSSATSPSPSPSATHRATPKPTTSRARHPAHHPRHSASPAAPPAADAVAPVEVLNNSRIQGLAHQVAAEVEGAGWIVSQVGNLQGRVAVTTVYYPYGEYDAAAHLARDFGQIMRIEPQSEAGLSSGSLVLVVTRYWTG